MSPSLLLLLFLVPIVISVFAIVIAVLVGGASRRSQSISVQPGSGALTRQPTSEVPPQIVDDYLRQGHQMQAILAVRNSLGLDLKEAVHYVELRAAQLGLANQSGAVETREPLGINNAVASNVVFDNPAVDQLILESRPIAAIKELRRSAHLGLKEAKERVEQRERELRGF